MSSGDVRADAVIAAKALDWDEPFALLDYDSGEDLEAALTRGIVFWAHHVITREAETDSRALALIRAVRREQQARIDVAERRQVRFEERRSDGLPNWWLSAQEQHELSDRILRQARA